jgi:hypothetical protein
MVHGTCECYFTIVLLFSNNLTTKPFGISQMWFDVKVKLLKINLQWMPKINFMFMQICFFFFWAENTWITYPPIQCITYLPTHITHIRYLFAWAIDAQGSLQITHDDIDYPNDNF